MFLCPTPAFESRIDIEGEHKGQRSFSFLYGYIGQHKKHFGQILLGLIVGCLIQLAMPFLTQAIVDVGITHQNLTLIWLILLGQLVLTVSRTTVDFIRRWLLLHISMRINISLVSDFFIKLLKLPMSFFDTKLMGDLLQRMADHKRVEQFLTTQTLSVMFSLLSFIIFGIVLFCYNWLIFVIFLAGSMLYGLWLAAFLNRRKTIDYELFEKQSVNNTKTYQFITSMQEIKLQNCEQRRRWEWEDVQADLFDVQMKNLKLQQKQEAGSILINEVKNIVITVVAAAAVIQGSMTLGMMLAVQYIIGQLNSPVEQLMKFIYSLQDVRISLERINEIHEMKNEESMERQLTMPDKEKKDLKFENVSFKYDPHSSQWTLDGINFTIPYGKTTAIVGASGSGKTTLLKLMLAYYDVQQGEIKIGDENLGRYDLKWWRRKCGVVMQDGVIFSESIAQNIAVDDEEISFDRLKHAIELANVRTFAERLPLKYSTQIGPDGMGLSQGQKQRILIARAIYKNPKYIFLDEATNALDAENIRTKVTVIYKDSEQIGMEALIPYRYINRIGKGMDINVEMERFPAHKYGSKHGTIKTVKDSLISRNHCSYFPVYLVMKAPFRYDMKMEHAGYRHHYRDRQKHPAIHAMEIGIRKLQVPCLECKAISHKLFEFSTASQKLSNCHPFHRVRHTSFA